MKSELPAQLLAVLCAAGGTTGYVRTGSVPSLVAGVSVGALYGFAGYRISGGRPYGVELALLASFVLGASSVPRAVRTGKNLPIGLSVLAIYGFYYYGTKYYQTR